MHPMIYTQVIDLADAVVYSSRPQHRSGDPCTNSNVCGQFTDLLRPRDQDLVFYDQLLEFIEKFRKSVDDLLCPRQPIGVRIHPAATETHVVTHHARARERLKQIEDFLALTKGIHQRRAPG